jgi:hypothetical protein
MRAERTRARPLIRPLPRRRVGPVRSRDRAPAAAVVAALLVAGSTITGCSSSAAPPRGPGPAPGPRSLQAASVASQEFGLLAGGGWAQAWALWSDTARQALSQADFVRLNTECRPALGQPYVIDTTTSVDETTVRVDWHRAAATGSDTVVYQAGAWHFVPDAAALAEYRLGVDRLLRARKAAGECH